MVMVCVNAAHKAALQAGGTSCYRSCLLGLKAGLGHVSTPRIGEEASIGVGVGLSISLRVGLGWEVVQAEV